LVQVKLSEKLKYTWKLISSIDLSISSFERIKFTVGFSSGLLNLPMNEKLKKAG
jgi:hypothetical protein